MTGFFAADAINHDEVENPRITQISGVRPPPALRAKKRGSISMGTTTKTLLKITALSIFCAFASLYAQAGDMLPSDTHKRFGGDVVRLEHPHHYRYQVIKVNSYGDWREVRATSKEKGWTEIEEAVGVVKKEGMAGTGFVVKSGAPKTRDFEVIVLNAHTYYDDDCRRKTGPFLFIANSEFKSSPVTLHLYRVGTKCPSRDLDKDWAVGIIYRRLGGVTPIDYGYLRNDKIKHMINQGVEFNLVGYNVTKDRIDSVNFAKAECRPFPVPDYWNQTHKHGLGMYNFLHNCPVRAGISGGPMVGKGKDDGGSNFYIALGVHSGEFYSTKKADIFDIKYNANVAVRFGKEFRDAIRGAGKFNSFAEFQADMRRRKWLVISERRDLDL